MGIAIGFIFIIHIILHWKWLVESTRDFWSQLKSESRLNYILDILIYIGFTTIIFSGLMISESFLPTFGFKAVQNHYWKEIHFVAVDFTLFLTALHFALHWRWIVNNCKRYIFKPSKDRVHIKETTEPVLVRTPKSHSANFSTFAKAGYRFFIILAFSGLISLGWYVASGTISAEPGNRLNRQRMEHTVESNFKLDADKRPERFGREHRGHRNEKGHNDERGSFHAAILKNILIFSIVTLAVTSISHVIKSKRNPLRPTLNT
ncbi:MAG: DUF4405 domain-containing protein [Cyclobacteriaceae bacterium]|nr:DUF4405 domain-containing protein [Cyclobacteriaceae bacterium]